MESSTTRETAFAGEDQAATETNLRLGQYPSVSKSTHPLCNGRLPDLHVSEQSSNSPKIKQRRPEEAVDVHHGQNEKNITILVKPEIEAGDGQAPVIIGEAEDHIGERYTGVSSLLSMDKENTNGEKETQQKTVDRYCQRAVPCQNENSGAVDSYPSNETFGNETANGCENSDGHVIHLVDDGNGVATFRVSSPAAGAQDTAVTVIEDGHIIVYEQGAAIEALDNDAGGYPGVAVGKVESDEPGESAFASRNASKTHLSIRCYPPTTGSCSRQDERASGRGSVPMSEIPQPGGYSGGRGGRHCITFPEKEEMGRTTYGESNLVRPLLHDCPRPAIPLTSTNCSNSNNSDGSREGHRHSATSAFNPDAPSQNQQAEPLVKTWTYSSDRDVPLTQHHYVGESAGCAYPATSGASSAVSMATSHPVYEDYMSNTPAITNAHPNYTDLSGAYPGYGSPYSSWPAACHTSAGHPENYHSYPMEAALPEAEHKIAMGYPHVHAHSIPASYPAHYPSTYLPAPSATYLGYAGDRTWHSGKNIAGEALDVPAGRHTGSVARDAAIYHHQHYQQQQQQLQPGIPKHISVPAPMGRGWDSSCPSPGWDTTTQRNARYTASGRGRGVRVDAAAQGKHSYNGGNYNARSAPATTSNNFVGRTRKRTASLPDGTADDKTTYQAGSAGIFPTKDPQARKRQRDAPYSVTSNVHTLKPGHIIAWYIDYLIHENEDRTQISRAFTLPVNLFHTDDFYFLESLRKKVRFPSPKFLAWMQRQLPSLNAHAIDFREGRPAAGSASGWNADWSWQSKSKRDIIHDVFFFFQHRKAANPERETVLTQRPKGPLVA